ncbi:MAG TPA: T9SS type A sorting domain-containing protein, partial [Phnomibacter sp.]|nr:T9SS type A sorting domain-containing protein [Phnomibacter sp.]
QLKAPPPATPTSLSAIVCNDAGQATVTLTGQANDFSGFYDPGPSTGGPAYPRRLNVTSTGNVTITNIELLSATQVRFIMNLSAASLGSQQTLTITNPDCQSVTFGYTLPAQCTGGAGPVGDFRVNRNPVQGAMVVTLPAASGSLRLLASDGKMVDSYQVTSTTMTIQTARYQAGIYFLEFMGEGKSQVIKLVIL